MSEIGEGDGDGEALGRHRIVEDCSGVTRK